MLGAKQGATEWSALPIGSVKEIGGPDEEGIAYLKAPFIVSIVREVPWSVRGASCSPYPGLYPFGHQPVTLCEAACMCTCRCR